MTSTQALVSDAVCTNIKFHSFVCWTPLNIVNITSITYVTERYIFISLTQKNAVCMRSFLAIIISMFNCSLSQTQWEWKKVFVLSWLYQFDWSYGKLLITATPIFKQSGVNFWCVQKTSDFHTSENSKQLTVTTS